jgi:non-ribosomal peptide synthetase component F
MDCAQNPRSDQNFYLEMRIGVPNVPIADQPYECRRNRSLTESNRTGVAYPAVCIHELFEQQVSRTPNRVAACFEGQQLTYSEINAKANRFPRYLAALGVSRRMDYLFEEKAKASRDRLNNKFIR